MKQSLNTSNRVLVVGDLMLDEYIFGNTSRISPEAPVPIVHLQKKDFRLGGAGNVANNLRALGSDVTLLAVVGDDENAKHIINLLNIKTIKSELVIATDKVTITKTRILGNNHQLLRVDAEELFGNDSTIQLAKKFSTIVSNFDMVVFSDYAKGTLTHIAEMIEVANYHNIVCIVDPKGKDFAKYSNATIVKPNLAEFELIVGKTEGMEDIYREGLALLQQLKLKAMLITLSEKGMVLLQQDGTANTFPAKVKEVYDVTGAGDTVLATLSYAIAAGVSLASAVQIANAAAACVVKKIGTTSISKNEYNKIKIVENLVATKSSIDNMREDDALVKFLASCRKNDNKIVFTNGCFDVLHLGHMRYLVEARKYGDVLIVGINSDSSVKLLKGVMRPINSLNDRMEMLMGIEVVDWVVSFNDETPEELIHKVSPDILVKGGDYQEHEVAGADFVKSNGGEVKLLKYHTGYSTTNLINSIKK